SPSGYPSAQATPALVVVRAGNPAASTTRAVTTSQTLGRTKIPGPACSLRNASAFSRRVADSIADPPRVQVRALSVACGLRLEPCGCSSACGLRVAAVILEHSNQR